MAQKNINEEKIIKSPTILTNKEKHYYIMLTEFYKKCSSDDIQQMLDIINGKSILSLRIIDWFVTRCSFKYKICIDNGDELFNIYISYKAQLKSYKKKYFDPFRRNSKFYFHYDLNDDSKYIYTTFGQLNFFKWAISNNILIFIKNNFNFIISTMSSNKNSKIRKKNNIGLHTCILNNTIVEKYSESLLLKTKELPINNYLYLYSNEKLFYNDENSKYIDIDMQTNINYFEEPLKNFVGICGGSEQIKNSQTLLYTPIELIDICKANKDVNLLHCSFHEDSLLPNDKFKMHKNYIIKKNILINGSFVDIYETSKYRDSQTKYLCVYSKNDKSSEKTKNIILSKIDNMFSRKSNINTNEKSFISSLTDHKQIVNFENNKDKTFYIKKNSIDETKNINVIHMNTKKPTCALIYSEDYNYHHIPMCNIFADKHTNIIKDCDPEKYLKNILKENKNNIGETIEKHSGDMTISSKKIADPCRCQQVLKESIMGINKNKKKNENIQLKNNINFETKSKILNKPIVLLFD